jgi:hypothetical protein
MYAIIDSDNRVIGDYGTNCHWVFCYGSKQEAKADAEKLGIPNYSIVPAENAIRWAKPSRYSK